MDQQSPIETTPEPLAVRIAARLRLAHGAEAIVRARITLRNASEARNIGRADLFVAVCTVLDDRTSAYARLWRPQAA